jgi:hypothetical protein
MMPRLMRDWENMERCGAGGGDMYSSTVLRIAAVISSRDPYGKQMFKTALHAALEPEGW